MNVVRQPLYTRLMGGQASKLQEELDRTQALLNAEQTRSAGLAADNARSSQLLRAQELKLVQREAELAAASQECEQRLDAKRRQRKRREGDAARAEGGDDHRVSRRI